MINLCRSERRRGGRRGRKWFWLLRSECIHFSKNTRKFEWITKHVLLWPELPNLSLSRAAWSWKESKEPKRHVCRSWACKRMSKLKTNHDVGNVNPAWFCYQTMPRSKNMFWMFCRWSFPFSSYARHKFWVGVQDLAGNGRFACFHS